MASNRRSDRSLFAICIESSHLRGMGHLYRAMNFAGSLVSSGYRCKFYINDHSPSLEILVTRGYEYQVVDLTDINSDWVETVIRYDRICLWINDRLNTTISHADRVKGCGIPLVTFDDRGEGAQLSDLHIAALALDDAESLAGGKVLCGVEYMILNPAIADYAHLRRSLKNIVITLGGSDTYGVTVKVVRYFSERGIGATVILGPGFAHHEELEKVLTPDFVVKKSVPSLIKEFSKHDLAITGGGITPFEANAAGLPCIVVANEIFEIPVGMVLAQLGGAVFAGYHDDIDYSIFSLDFSVEKMSQVAMDNIKLDGCNKVVNEMLELLAV